jgi:hypothetical protein
VAPVGIPLKVPTSLVTHLRGTAFFPGFGPRWGKIRKLSGNIRTGHYLDPIMVTVWLKRISELELYAEQCEHLARESSLLYVQQALSELAADLRTQIQKLKS